MSGSDVNPQQGGVSLEPWARELLRCPVTGATLVDGVDADGAPVLISTHPTDPRTYAIRDGIPILLADDPYEAS
jgi:uncharacterized protein YbaR (Trm112 family)